MFRKENLHKLWKNILKEAQIKNILLFREPSSQENLVSQPWPPVSSSIRDFYCTEQLKSSFSHAFSECEH